MYAHFSALNGPLTDIERLRVERRARVAKLVLEQPVLPGVREYLADAKRSGLKLGFASSSAGDYVRGHLKRLELFDYFHTTKCYEDTATHKPDPGPYRAVLEELGVSPVEAVAFEDSPNGVTAARAAGICCVAVPNPMTQSLSLAHADFCFKSLAEAHCSASCCALRRPIKSEPVSWHLSVHLMFSAAWMPYAVAGLASVSTRCRRLRCR